MHPPALRPVTTGETPRVPEVGESELMVAFPLMIGPPQHPGQRVLTGSPRGPANGGSAQVKTIGCSALPSATIRPSRWMISVPCPWPTPPEPNDPVPYQPSMPVPGLVVSVDT